MNANVDEEFERSYWMLVEDSFLLLSAAEAQPHNELASSLARAAIFNALVLPEVAANCCIEDLGLESSVYKEVDRLSIVAKFDFYLRTKFRAKSLCRGCLQVQSLNELKILRDGYVHSKRRRVAWIGPEDGVQAAERPVTQILGIAKNPRDWWQQDAVLAVAATHAFLKYFFVDCCRYNRNTVASLLSSSSEVPERGNYYIPQIRRPLKDDLERWGVDISYVRHGWIK